MTTNFMLVIERAQKRDMRMGESIGKLGSPPYSYPHLPRFKHTCQSLPRRDLIATDQTLLFNSSVIY